MPAAGYSYLDLYLMGLIAPSEVPDFFILRNLHYRHGGGGARRQAQQEMIERPNGIRERWIDYWETVAGHRSQMTAAPR